LNPIIVITIDRFVLENFLKDFCSKQEKAGIGYALDFFEPVFLMYITNIDD